MTTIHNLLDMSMDMAYGKTQCDDSIKSGDFLLVEDGIAMMDGAYPVMISGVSDVFHEYNIADPDGHERHAAALAQYKALEAAEAKTGNPEYVCPECGCSKFELVVTQLVDVNFLTDGDHDITDGPRGDTEWGDDTHAVCCGCHWSGTLGDAKDTQ